MRQPADEKLDPLNVGPDLHPIQEERTPRSNVEPERRSVPDAAKVRTAFTLFGFILRLTFSFCIFFLFDASVFSHC